MRTRCPHCSTLFEIQERQLQAASGQARCSRCDNIFNAKKHLTQVNPEDSVVLESDQPEKTSGPISLKGLFETQEPGGGLFQESNTALFSTGAPGTGDSGTTDEWQVKSASNKPFTHPDKSKTDAESVGLHDEQPVTTQLEGGEYEPPPSEPAEEATEQVQRLQSSDSEEIDCQPIGPDSIFQAGNIHKKREMEHPVLWSIAILCLLVTALAQMLWFTRGNLKQYPEIRELLEFVCTQTGCELPPWHEPERFVISSRSVRTHPSSSSALQIQLVFSNTARFAQLYPHLQLSLYDTNEKLTAQRVFRPEEYFTGLQHNATLIKPDQSVAVEMALADPGVDVTGFRIEFL